MLPTSHGCWESALIFAESPFDCLNVQFWLGFLVWITWLQIFRWLKPVFVCSSFTFQIRADFFCGYKCRACVYGAPTKKKNNFWRTGNIDGPLPEEGAWLVKVPIMVDLRKFQKHPHGQPSFGANHPFLVSKIARCWITPKREKWTMVNHPNGHPMVEYNNLSRKLACM